MLVDLKHQENSFDDWRRTWRISEQTPHAVLLQCWIARRLNIINEKLKRINSDLEKARKKLGRLAEIRNDDWEGMSKARRMSYTELFIWTKRKYVQDLIESCPKNMAVIKEESDAGWYDQQEILSREIAHIRPYHVQGAHLLVQVAKQNLNDAVAVRTCCQVVKDDITIFLDLDLFNAFAAVTEDQHVERIEQILQAGHLKVELLLREANRQGAELPRVVIERVSTGASPESMIVDAFRAILGTSDRTHYFTSNASTLFCLSKCRRAEVPVSTLQKPFREVLAHHDPPTYNAPDEKFLDHEIVLGKLSNARAAFELAQSCLFFLRNSWIQELCRCTVRFGVLSEVPAGNEYQFSLELVETTHQPPSLRDPHQPRSNVDGSSEPSWCMKNYHWYGLNESIRHLGLLLVELFPSTVQ